MATYTDDQIRATIAQYEGMAGLDPFVRFGVAMAREVLALREERDELRSVFGAVMALIDSGGPGRDPEEDEVLVLAQLLLVSDWTPQAARDARASENARLRDALARGWQSYHEEYTDALGFLPCDGFGAKVYVVRDKEGRLMGFSQVSRQDAFRDAYEKARRALDGEEGA